MVAMQSQVETTRSPNYSVEIDRSPNSSAEDTVAEELSASEMLDCDEQGQNIMWTGYQAGTPVLLFRPDVIARKIPERRAVGERFHMTFKIMKTECKLVRAILTGHGFREANSNSSDFNLMWTGSHLKPFVLRNMTDFQKINHFPRSYEITRKDRLFKNIQKMQETKGFRYFDFVPSSFILPTEYQDFCTAFLREKGAWIVKPIASSRGRGIFLINHPDQVPLDEQVIVCKYIANPYLIDGYKFDVRLYVAVTSYDPLVVYLYEEGLARFATVKFDKASRFMRNNCMHLTNYSVNKRNLDYVQNDDAEVEDFGNKWSLGALLRYLKSEGKDVSALMCRIEDVVVKTVLSVESHISTACKLFMPFKGNCFELYGFDILLDEGLRPWVLEVNLSPSLACDTPLDLKIKASMIADLFSLIGFICQDPMMRRVTPSKRNADITDKTAARSLRVRPGSTPSSHQRSSRPGSASSVTSSGGAPGKGALAGLSGEEIRIVRRVKEEKQRAGGWVRILPTHDSWDLYGHFFTSSSSHNSMLHQRLFADKPSDANKSQSAVVISARLSRSIQLHAAENPCAVLATQGNRDFGDRAKRRTLLYERKLRSLHRHGARGRKYVRTKHGGRVYGDFRGDIVAPETTEDENDVTDCDEMTSLEPVGSLETVTSLEPVGSREAVILQRESKTCEDSRAEVGVQQVVDGSDRVDSTVERQPPIQESSTCARAMETRLDLIKYLENGGSLSKVQARTAFASYLLLVKQRLKNEDGPIIDGDVDDMNQQMDLVLRFLKRAAGNLQTPFRVVVPSRKLGITDRQRILARQLSDFVLLYGRETEQLRRTETELPRGDDTINADSLADFLSTACENELEEVLTVYTKVHKSASIFIGSSCTNGVTSHRSSANPGTAVTASAFTNTAASTTSAATTTSTTIAATTTSTTSAATTTSTTIGAVTTSCGTNEQGTDSNDGDTAAVPVRGFTAERSCNKECGESSRVSVESSRAPRNSTGPAVESSRAPRDSTGPAVESSRAPRDSTGPTVESSRAAVESSRAPVDSIGPAMLKAYHRRPTSSYASAVQLYSGRLTSPSSSQRARPASAVTTTGETFSKKRAHGGGSSRRQQQQQQQLAMNAIYGGPTRKAPSVAVTTQPVRHQVTDQNEGNPNPCGNYSEEVILNEALQRLSLRQQARQYSVHSAKSANVLMRQKAPNISQNSDAIAMQRAYSAQAQGVRNSICVSEVDLAVGDASQCKTNYDVIDKDTCTETAVSKYGRVSCDQNRSVTPMSANVNYHLNEIAHRLETIKNKDMYERGHDLVTEQKHDVSFLDHQSMIRQRRMMEQSKALLEQSKAKHQAMIAQAHAATALGALSPYAPTTLNNKPPSAPTTLNNKPPSAPNTRSKPQNLNRQARPVSFEGAKTSDVLVLTPHDGVLVPKVYMK